MIYLVMYVVSKPLMGASVPWMSWAVGPIQVCRDA